MGLLSDSTKLREQLLSKNLYNPDNVYDLKSDVVTRTLDTLQNVGFDVRSKFVPSLIENIVDNTPLLKIAYERLAIEFARRAVDNTLNPININLLAPFDNNPDTKLFSKQKSYTITPSENEGKFNFKNALDKLFNVHDKSTPLDRYKNNVQYNSEAFFNNTGEGQKSFLLANLNQNKYSKYTGILLRDFTISSKFANERFKGYGKEGFDYDNGYILEKNRKTTNVLPNSKLTSLGEAISNRNLEKDILENEGFGFNDIKNTKSEVLKDTEIYKDIYYGQYEDGLEAINTFTYGDNKEDDDNFKVKRGLLYYTSQLAKSGNQVGENIKSNNTVFNTDKNGNKTYKGNEHRNFTIGYQNDKYSKMMRFKGNYNNDSVLKENVFSKIYPRTDNDGNVKDNRFYMFSIENLTYNASEWADLPDCERGTNGGRIMWFAPYGIKINESSSANQDAEKFLGRIEPLYTYAGSERKMTLSFDLLIDKPPNINDYNLSDLDKYFMGIDVEKKKNTKSRNNNEDILTPKEQSSVTEPKAISDIVFYFDNNLYDVDQTISSGYEFNSSGKTSGDIKNLEGLNKDFNSRITELVAFMQSEDSNYFEFKIEGYASDLATTDYNTGLSFRRSNRLMNYIIEQYNSNANSKIGLSFPNGLDTGAMYLDYTTEKIGKKLSFKCDSLGKKLLFTINAFSDSKSNPIGKVATEVNNPTVKRDRYCKLSFSRRSDVKKESELQSMDVKNTTSDTNDSKLNKENKDLSSSNSDNNNGQSCADPFLKHKEYDTKVPMGYEKVNYYTPAFNSQTPLDFHNRLTFLQQLTRPGSSLESSVGVNSIFGKQPSQILRVGDFFHTKIIVNSVSYDYSEAPWDMNSEGLGVQPMLARITMDIILIGGESMKFAIDKLQNAISKNYYANSTFVGKIISPMKDNIANMNTYYQSNFSSLKSEDLQGELYRNRNTQLKDDLKNNKDKDGKPKNLLTNSLNKEINNNTNRN